MTARLAHIWRHPVKAIGREELNRTTLTPGRWLPFDRLWAVAHDRARLDGGWGAKANFLRGVTEPQLMAATAALSDDGSTLTLDHPVAGQLTIAPDSDADTALLLDWLGRIWPAELPAPTGLYRADSAHLTDMPDPFISINNTASHRAVSQRVGQDLSIHRWRGNLWLDGLGPWQEFEWIGKEIRIGEATLAVRQRITRCKATMANPETGRRDADTLGALSTWDHQDFGVYAEVTHGGIIAAGDPVEVPA
ncbi:MAG: MOSC domain-containing protein [Rhodobacteraceae bacterium]|nr:MOSC domain-containing protein [Alphaproteobacteria bacterium]MBT8475670.1 MOSC domain-containing protein [Alphaproteobacteria bacterium]NNK65338.1 MOSC domain-containing protein [Paracoccaceae bacterium]